MQMPQVSNPNFNYYIKEVARLAGATQRIKAFTHIGFFAVRMVLRSLLTCKILLMAAMLLSN